MYYFGKAWISYFAKGIVAMIIILCTVMWMTYDGAKQVVNQQFPELVRMVAEDNCLDDSPLYSGESLKSIYLNKLEEISNSSPFIEFRTGAVEVSVVGRNNAPQRGTPIHVKLTGYWTCNVPFLGNQQVELPIVREMDVIGIREYRDR